MQRGAGAGEAGPSRPARPPFLYRAYTAFQRRRESLSDGFRASASAGRCGRPLARLELHRPSEPRGPALPAVLASQICLLAGVPAPLRGRPGLPALPGTWPGPPPSLLQPYISLRSWPFGPFFPELHTSSALPLAIGLHAQAVYVLGLVYSILRPLELFL